MQVNETKPSSCTCRFHNDGSDHSLLLHMIWSAVSVSVWLCAAQCRWSVSVCVAYPILAGPGPLFVYHSSSNVSLFYFPNVVVAFLCMSVYMMRRVPRAVTCCCCADVFHGCTRVEIPWHSHPVRVARNKNSWPTVNLFTVRRTVTNKSVHITHRYPKFYYDTTVTPCVYCNTRN